MSQNLLYTTQIRDNSNTLLSVLLTNVSSPSVTINANSNVSISTNNSVTLANANASPLTFTLGYANAVNFVTIKKIDPSGNTVTVAANGSQTIDGSANVVLTSKSSVTLVNDGSNWYIY